MNIFLVGLIIGYEFSLVYSCLGDDKEVNSMLLFFVDLIYVDFNELDRRV